MYPWSAHSNSTMQVQAGTEKLFSVPCLFGNYHSILDSAFIRTMEQCYGHSSAKLFGPNYAVGIRRSLELIITSIYTIPCVSTHLSLILTINSRAEGVKENSENAFLVRVTEVVAGCGRSQRQMMAPLPHRVQDFHYLPFRPKNRGLSRN
jgi:hypothetical protein